MPKLVRVPLTFQRTGRFIMEGACAVDLEAGDWTWEELVEQAKKLVFSEYVQTDITFIDDEDSWDFDLPGTEREAVNDEVD